MSKSRGNVINPDDVVAEHGADVLRLYEMFMGDFEQQKPWDTRAIVGLVRFVHNVWRIVEEPKRVSGDPHRRLRHKTIRAVGERIEALKFNTAISALMEYVGELQSNGSESGGSERRSFAWSPPSRLTWPRRRGSISATPRSSARSAGHSIDGVARPSTPTVTVAIQVSGKMRGTVDVPRGADEAAVRAAAESLATGGPSSRGEEAVAKTIFVPDRLLNLVAR